MRDLHQPPVVRPLLSIDWRGPFGAADLPHIAGAFGLYLLVGQHPHTRKPTIRYIGRTTDTFRARFVRHHIIPLLAPGYSLWTGRIAPSQARGLRRVARLIHAETLLIVAFQPDLNQQSRLQRPAPATVQMRWFTTAYQPTPNPFIGVPDEIVWDGRCWHWRTEHSGWQQLDGQG